MFVVCSLAQCLPRQAHAYVYCVVCFPPPPPQPTRSLFTVAGLPEVTCLPLSSIQHHLGVQHIKLFFLDVEGAELMVLQSLDFSAVTFDVIAVVQDGSNADKDQGVIDILQRNGWVGGVGPGAQCGTSPFPLSWLRIPLHSRKCGLGLQ